MPRLIMERLVRLHAATQRDRGDSPVPTAIIIAGLAAAAGAVVLAATGLVNEFMGGIGGGTP
jgi:hypothetical protein